MHSGSNDNWGAYCGLETRDCDACLVSFQCSSRGLHTCGEYYILLTVHHVMILGKRPTWRTIPFSVFLFIFNSLHVSSTSCSSSGETNCVNTTSGSCHFRPAHDTATDTEWQLPEVVLTQFVSPDDEHDVLETCRVLNIKINTQKGIVRHVGRLPRIITWCTVNRM